MKTKNVYVVHQKIYKIIKKTFSVNFSVQSSNVPNGQFVASTI